MEVLFLIYIFFFNIIVGFLFSFSWVIKLSEQLVTISNSYLNEFFHDFIFQFLEEKKSRRVLRRQNHICHSYYSLDTINSINNNKKRSNRLILRSFNFFPFFSTYYFQASYLWCKHKRR